MGTPLIPQEVYLLERYTSVQYFSDMRDAWQSMVNVAERALDAFVHQLPKKYRSRPLYDQPDIVWGDRVLVNFRYTLDCLNRGFIELTHGNMRSLGYADNVKSDFAGFSRDYSAGWMNEPDVAVVLPNAAEIFWDCMILAVERASNISATLRAHWNAGELSSRYGKARGPLNPPAEWPVYEINPKVRVFSDAPAPCTGIYLPDADDSAPAFMIKNEPAHLATIGFDEKTRQNIAEMPAWWTLVERVADAGGGIPGERKHLSVNFRNRCDARQPCPRAGYWFTPAKAGSRRHFEAGETMPSFESGYGLTIWQWDENQGS